MHRFASLTTLLWPRQRACLKGSGDSAPAGSAFLIYNSMQLFQYQQVVTELGVVVVYVLALERFSTILRSRIQ